ncbi:hypothetical protein F5884DRAFT_750645 [Xylogone sp. PMI_703]|nr:hypothetical protein F5884DRAFT_750645 [Xylogone sp. PMI_703]
MPVYEVIHSYPLTKDQKARLAESITHLHSTKFHTPSLYVNIRFVPAEQTGDFFIAGKPTVPTSPNRIMALVRVGSDRTKQMFDDLALKIMASWNEIVEYDDSIHVETLQDKERKLHLVGFQGVITGVENGVLLPGTGEEKTWLATNMAYFKERAEVCKDEKFADMLKEIELRPDLKVQL